MLSSRTRGSLSVAVTAIALCAVSVPSVRADVLRTGGTGAASGMLSQISVALAARDPGTTLEVIPSLGSSGGIAAVADEALDFAVSSRPIKPEEAAKGLTEIVLARTPFVLASSHSSPNGIKSTEVAGFYAAATSVWADGKPVRVVLRPKSESDTALLGNAFPGMAAAIDQVRTRADVPLAATDQDNAQMAEEIPGSLVAASYTQIMMEKRNLRFVAIDGVEPTLENFERGAYPYSKEFHFVFPAKKSATVERFIAFLRSPDGQKILRDTGNLPASR